MLPVRETLEHPDRVVADGRYAESLPPDRVQMLFQLDELNLAERSPIRRTEEHEHGPFRAHDGFEGLVPALLVPRGKIRYLLAHVCPVLMIWPYAAVRGAHIANSMRALLAIQAPRLSERERVLFGDHDNRRATRRYLHRMGQGFLASGRRCALLECLHG